MKSKKVYNPSFVEAFLGLENRDSFLAKIQTIIDFEEFRPLLESCYSQNGRPGYDPIIMFKILLLEQWYDLSDVQVIEQVKDRISFRSFTIGDFNSPIPDDSSLVRFRKRLRDCNAYDKLLNMLNLSIENNEIQIKTGKMIAVDATIVEAKTKKKESEAGAEWVKRDGKKTILGYKVHAAMDTQTRIIEEVKVTSASEHETNHLLIPDDTDIILADKGYDSTINRKILAKRDIIDGIMRKKPKNKTLSDEDREHNRLVGGERAKIESKFGEMKNYNGLKRAKYVGIDRFKLQVILTVFAVNIKRYIKLVS